MANSPILDALETLHTFDEILNTIIKRSKRESPGLVYKRLDELKKLTEAEIKKLTPANFGDASQGGKNA